MSQYLKINWNNNQEALIPTKSVIDNLNLTHALTADKLTTAQDIGVNLGSEGAEKFDGSESVFIGVDGILNIKNGGTGGDTAQDARQNLGFTNKGNLTTPIYFSSSGSIMTCTPYSNANVLSATKLATSRTIRTNLSITNNANFDGTANVTPGITGTLTVNHGGTGATVASTARTNLGCASDNHVHVVGKVNSQTTLWSGQLTPGNTISVSNANEYALIMVEVECGQFRATRTIYPNSGGYWCAVTLPNNTQVVFQAVTGLGSSAWKIYNDTTTSSGGKVISVTGLKFKTTDITNY